MISYSSEFPLKAGTQPLDVVRLIHKWIVGSPHASVVAQDLVEPAVNSEATFQRGREAVTTVLLNLGGEECCGVRYVSHDSTGLEWSTTVVCNKVGSELAIGIQVSCDAGSAIPKLPSARKPYLVKLLLSELGGGMDGEVPVSDRPIHLGALHSGAAAALLTGMAGNRLPIVYVSIGFDGKYLVDPATIARWVSGNAHVIVEPSLDFSYKLRELCGAINVFGGSIGVYWPGAGKRRSYFADSSNPSEKRIAADIASDVRAAMTNRRQSAQLGWLHLREQLAKAKLEALRAEGSAGVESYVEVFDEELRAKQARIDELEMEAARLTALASRNVFPSKKGGSFFQHGSEREFYDGEIAGVLIDALSQYKGSVLAGGRREHIIDDLLAANERTSLTEVLDDEVKRVFRNYTAMDRETRRALEQMGFEISDDGRHHKAVYWGDPRYSFTIAKTPSDHRAGLNLYSEITKKVL